MSKVDFKKQLKNNGKIIENFSYLSILQVFAILLPFATYPYLFRVIGKELYGKIIFAQTIITYISLIINFGFNISGSKSCAICRDDRAQLSEVVSAIYSGKLFLWIMCLIIYIIIITTVYFFKADFWLYFISFFITFNELLFPVWFFQGIEKMKYTTIVDVSARLFFTILIFVLVKSKSHYLYVPILNACGALLAGILSSFLVFVKEKITFFILPIKKIYCHFKDAIPLFASIASTQIYLNANKLLVGSFLGMANVAVYDAGAKVSGLLKVPIQVLSQAVFPKVCRDKKISFINKILFISLAISVVMYACIFLESKIIVQLLMGEINYLAVNILRILCLAVIFSSVNTFLAGGRLIPFGHSKQYMKLVIANSLFFLAGIVLLSLMNAITIYTLAIMIVLVEIFYLISLLICNWRLGILKNNEL